MRSATCSARAARSSHVRQHGTDFEPLLVAEVLVRSLDSPRSVRHCLTNCLHATEKIGGENRAATRLLGRICAEIEFADPVDASGAAVAAGMGTLLSGISSIGEALTKAYFSSRSVPVAAIAAKEVQQQQCG